MCMDNTGPEPPAAPAVTKVLHVVPAGEAQREAERAFAIGMIAGALLGGFVIYQAFKAAGPL